MPSWTPWRRSASGSSTCRRPVSASGRPSRPRAPEGNCPLRLLLDRLDLDVDLHLVAHDHAAPLDDAMPVHAEVLAVDARGGVGAHPAVALRVPDRLGRTLHLEDHLPRDVADGQIPHHVEALGPHVLYPLRLEGDGRELLGVEEVVAAQVVVAPGDARVDALRLDGDVRLDGARSFRATRSQV